MASEILRAEISNISKPGGKLQWMGQHSWDFKVSGPGFKNGIQRASGGISNWEQENQRKADLLFMSNTCMISSYSTQLSTTQQKNN